MLCEEAATHILLSQLCMYSASHGKMFLPYSIYYGNAQSAYTVLPVWPSIIRKIIKSTERLTASVTGSSSSVTPQFSQKSCSRVPYAHSKSITSHRRRVDGIQLTTFTELPRMLLSCKGDCLQGLCHVKSTCIATNVCIHLVNIKFFFFHVSSSFLIHKCIQPYFIV